MKKDIMLNSVLTALVLIHGFLTWLVGSESASSLNIEKFISVPDYSIEFRALIAFSVLGGVLISGTLFIKLLWDKLLPVLFGVKKITFNQAYGFMLLYVFISNIV